MGFLVRWLVTFLAIWVTAYLGEYAIPGLLGPGWFRMDTLEGGAVFAGVLALLNAFVRPIVMVLTCPIQVLTLGLATLLINALIFLLAAYVTGLFPFGGVSVDGFIAAFVATLVVSIVGWLVSMVVKT